jgi:serine/threonine protein kinase
MALTTGSRLGPHEITALLGAGGMGEVYRARDTRLKREVALKILPESFAADPDRLARFQREAEVLASARHESSPDFKLNRPPAIAITSRSFHLTAGLFRTDRPKAAALRYSSSRGRPRARRLQYRSAGAPTRAGTRPATRSFT